MRRPNKLQDEFTKLPVSHQRKAQLRNIKEGKCMICGKPLVTKNYCLKHAIAVRDRQRKYKVCKKKIISLTRRIEAQLKMKELIGEV